MMKKIVGIIMLFVTINATAQSNSFCIAKDGKAVTIVVDEQDWKGVIRAVNDLGDDVRKVCGTASPVVKDLPSGDNCIIIGTIGKSALIDKLVKQKKLDVKNVKGQWESFVIDVIDGNLVIAGSDKRGTIYGIYTISERIGVSPIDARQGLHDEFKEYTQENLARSKVLKPLPPHNNFALSGYWNGRRLARRDEVFDNMRWLEVRFKDIPAGHHKLKLIMVDPEIVVEQIVVNPDNKHYSYFGKK
jgi:hypothetical protein